MNASLPQRSRTYGVGKEIGGAIYVHRSAEHVFGAVVDAARVRLPEEFEYHVVKFVPKTGTLSFVCCFDFDEADEPTVGQIVSVSLDGMVRHRPQSKNPEIYHHKWLFVMDDYEGFDVEESQERSRSWLHLPDVDKRKIGRKAYWEQEVLPRIKCP